MDEQNSNSLCYYCQNENHKFWYNCHFFKAKITCYRHPPRRASDSQICTALYMAVASNMFPIVVYRTLDCIVCLCCKCHESRTMSSYSLNFQYISLCLTYMRYPLKYSMIFFISQLCWNYGIFPSKDFNR